MAHWWQSPYVLITLVCLFLVITANFTFFSKVNAVYTGSTGFLLSLPVVLLGVMLLLAALLAWHRAVKGVLILLVVVAAASAYMVDTYGIVIDSAMLANVAQTNTSEARDLFNIKMLLRLVLLVLIPAWLIWRYPLVYPQWRHAIWQRGLLFGAALALIALPIWSLSQTYASFFREHKSLRFYTNPVTPIYSLGKYASEQYRLATRPTTLQLMATDAHLIQPSHKPELVVVVVGETARANHFSLNGYNRNTNPLLSQQSSLFSFKQVTSCGTSTAYSVPCMFSLRGMAQFDLDQAPYEENVLDVLKREGVRILWRDNNSDSKGVATRVTYQNYRDPSVNPVCDEECRDEGMLAGLTDYVRQGQGQGQQGKDTLIVLHQMGNHGPAYYKRYPKRFEVFKPVCQTNELAQCAPGTLINGYDNAILYTDYVLNQLIEQLKPLQQDYEVTMIYLSDHGESLGEKGIYLHGMPAAFAPDEQRQVPLIIWSGRDNDIMLDTLKQRQQQPTSHDGLAPTLLHLFEVDSQILHDKPSYFAVSELAHQQAKVAGS